MENKLKGILSAIAMVVMMVTGVLSYQYTTAGSSDIDIEFGMSEKEVKIYMDDIGYDVTRRGDFDTKTNLFYKKDDFKDSEEIWVVVTKDGAVSIGIDYQDQEEAFALNLIRKFDKEFWWLEGTYERSAYDDGWDYFIGNIEVAYHPPSDWDIGTFVVHQLDPNYEREEEDVKDSKEDGDGIVDVDMKYNGWDAFAISEGYLRQSNPDIFLIEDGAKIYFKHKYARFRYKLDDTNNIAARYNWVNLKKKGRMTTGFEPKTISIPLQTGLVIRYNQHGISDMEDKFLIRTYKYDGTSVNFSFEEEGRFMKVTKIHFSEGKVVQKNTYITFKVSEYVYETLDGDMVFALDKGNMYLRQYWGDRHQNYSTFYIKETVGIFVKGIPYFEN